MKSLTIHQIPRGASGPVKDMHFPFRSPINGTWRIEALMEHASMVKESRSRALDSLKRETTSSWLLELKTQRKL